MMKDERRQRLLDQYEDATLQLLMDEYAEAEGERLLKEFEEAERRGEVEDIPEELDQKCRQIIHRSFTAKKRKDRAASIGKMLGKVAVVVLLLTGFSTTIVLSVEAFRIPILNYLIKHDTRFSSLLFTDEDENEGVHPLEDIEIKDCVPKDFTLYNHTFDDDGTSHFYYKDSSSNYISILVSPSTGMLNYDAEDLNQLPMQVNDHEAIFISGEILRIIWLDAERNCVFDVSTKGLPENEFWKVVYRIAK